MIAILLATTEGGCLDRVSLRWNNKSMRRITVLTVLTALLAPIVLLSCAPVFDRSLMKQGVRDISLSLVRENPDAFRGRLFILGGIIVSTKLTEQGAVIEALAVPVDSYGYLKYDTPYDGRFLALYPRSRGLIDPMIYSKGREITVAGEFVEVRKGKIDEMEYVYPVFEVKRLHLWQERAAYYYYGYPYYPYYPYPYSRYPYWYYDPWRYPAWEPWGRPWPQPYYP